MYKTGNFDIFKPILLTFINISYIKLTGDNNEEGRKISLFYYNIFNDFWLDYDIFIKLYMGRI